VIFVALAVMLVGVVVYFGSAYMVPAAKPQAIRHMYGLILYSTSLLVLGLNFSAFATQSMVREKTQRVLESVLATPTSVRRLWISRVLAVLLPATIMSTAVTLAVALVVALTTAEIGLVLIQDPWVILAGFVWVPLSYLAIALLAQAVGLTRRPVSAGVIYQIYLPLAANVVIQLGVRFVVLTDTWVFALANLMVVAGFGIPALLLGRRLTAQQVTVSPGK
jgi:ABC-type Na+ efflux pump permease subunit